MRTADQERKAAAHGAVASGSVRPSPHGAADPAGAAGPELSAQARAERGTRARVARLILELGPSTASVIGGRAA